MTTYGRRSPDEIGELRRANAERPARRPPPVLRLPVVGLTFVPGYPATVRELLAAWQDAETSRRTGTAPRVVLAAGPAERAEAVLVGSGLPGELRRPCPPNPADPRAVEVWCAGVRVGHVPATTHGRWAGPVADEIDAGTPWAVIVERVRVNPAHPDRPGVDAVLVRGGSLQQLTPLQQKETP